MFLRKIITYGVGIATAIGGCHVSNRIAGNAERALNRSILIDRGLKTIVDECDSFPTKFSYEPPATPPATPSSDDVRLCYQLNVDKLAIADASKEMVRLAQVNEARGVVPEGFEVAFTALRKFEEAIVRLRGGESLRHEARGLAETRQVNADRNKIMGIKYPMYTGNNLSQVVDNKFHITDGRYGDICDIFGNL